MGLFGRRRNEPFLSATDAGTSEKRRKRSERMPRGYQTGTPFGSGQSAMPAGYQTQSPYGSGQSAMPAGYQTPASGGATGALPTGYQTPGSAVPNPYGSLVFAIEDTFAISGRGTVVVGQVAAGQVSVGDQVQLVRGGTVLARTEVRGLEKNRKRANNAMAGEYAGLLVDLRRDAAQRGDELRS